MIRTRPSASALVVLAACAVILFMLLLSAGPASAEVETSGTGTMALGSGKTGKALAAAKVRIGAVKPATSTRKGPVTRVVAPVSSVVAGSKSTVGLNGGLVFKRGKRKVAFSKMNVQTTPKRATVTALTGGKRIAVLTGEASTVVDTVEGRITLSGAKVSLTKAAASVLRTRLTLRRLFAGPAGTLSVSARWTEIVPLVDPYFEQCGLAATSKTVGSVPGATALPTLTGPKALTGAVPSWAVKSTLNGYINSIGSIVGLEGATVNRVPGPPSIPPTGFTFPLGNGQLAENGPGTQDEQAVVNGTGTVVYCNAPHGFRIAISNPTIVIDGANSRIIADVDTNISGDWMPTQRVDLVTLDLTEIVPTVEDGISTTWTNVPTTLTQAGSDALRLCEVSVPGAPPGCLYPAGTAFAPITVVALID
jgi:hypothetical protein